MSNNSDRLLLLHLKPEPVRGSFTNVAKRYVYFWEVYSYLRNVLGKSVRAVDCVSPEHSWHFIARAISSEKISKVAMLVRAGNARSSVGFARYLKKVFPTVRIMLFGDVLCSVGGFEKLDCVDAVHAGGDFELGIESFYFNEVSGQLHAGHLPQWEFADPHAAPVQIYNQMIGDKKEFTLGVQRGCPYGCHYCHASALGTLKVRHASPKRIIDQIHRHRAQFDSFRLFAPVFGLSRQWWEELASLLGKDRNTRWCCTTRLELLDADIVRRMYEGGCYKISIGLEQFSSDGTVRGIDLDRLRIIADAANFHPRDYSQRDGMSIVALFMIGTPNQTIEDVRAYFKLCSELSLRPRPTAYSSFARISQTVSDGSDDMLLNLVESADKLTRVDQVPEGMTETQALKVILEPWKHQAILDGDSSIQSGYSMYAKTPDTLFGDDIRRS